VEYIEFRGKDFVGVGAGFKPAPTSASTPNPAILNVWHYRKTLVLRSTLERAHALICGLAVHRLLPPTLASPLLFEEHPNATLADLLPGGFPLCISRR
jgi:hypothetical protein